MSNSTWETRPNTASAFKSRPNEEGDFTGEADIDSDKYRVTVGKEEAGQKHTMRDITFVGADNGLTFSGKLFDNKRDSATGQERELKANAPRWTGTVKCAVNDELTVEKRVSIWEKPTRKTEGVWMSMSIKDNVPYTPSAAASTEDAPF
jgi:hypothetical protein